VNLKWPFALLLAAVAATLSAQATDAQLMEVQQSSGFVEVLLPDLGWRQAVIGRQVPAGSVITSWTDASAKVGYGDSLVSLEQLSHLKVLSISSSLIRFSLESGGIVVETPTSACEIEFRGMVVRIENGSATLNDGSLAVRSGSVVVNGAGRGPLPVAAGATISLLSPPAGPVFGSTHR
jgi:hypothetical protein